jgi:hypothetical protein
MKMPEGVKTHKTDWGNYYSYKGIHIARGAGRHSSRYDFRVGEARIMASTIADAVKTIDALQNKEN